METALTAQPDFAASPAAAGRYVFGLGLIFMGALSLAWGDFITGQGAVGGLGHAPLQAYAAGAIMAGSGAALLVRRTAAMAAVAIVAFFLLIVTAAMDGADFISHWTVYGEYESAAEQFAVAAAGLIVFAAQADIDAALARRLMRIGQVVFGLCALVFGGAHFAYMNLTVPLVPKWLPPSQVFWATATGTCHIAAGLAIISGFRARLAAILLTLMYAGFQPLVHIPMLLATPSSHFLWGENAINLALTGAAWVVADALARPER